MQMKGIFLKLMPLALAALLSACSDENAFAAGEEQMEDSKEEAFWDAKYSSAAAVERDCYNRNFELNTAAWCCSSYGYGCETACYLGTASYSDSWCCTYYGYQCATSSSSSSCDSWYGCSSSSSSSSDTYSSSSAAKYYLETSKTMKLSLTYYAQTSTCWDDAVCLFSTTSDGDPEVSFKIRFVTYAGVSTTKNTGVLLDLTDQGAWSGTKTVTIAVPVYTDSIIVYPRVIDEDLIDDDDKSSGWGFSVKNVGYLDDYDWQYQSDTKSTHYTLKWNWYLY